MNTNIELTLEEKNFIDELQSDRFDETPYKNPREEIEKHKIRSPFQRCVVHYGFSAYAQYHLLSDAKKVINKSITLDELSNKYEIIKSCGKLGFLPHSIAGDGIYVPKSILLPLSEKQSKDIMTLYIREKGEKYIQIRLFDSD